MLISAAKATEAAGVLGVELEGLTPNTLSSAYRRRAKECHPDQHGTAKLTEWSRVDWANKALKGWLEKHPAEQPSESLPALKGDCRACGGTGRVALGTGGFGKPLTMQCVYCRGEGTVTPLEVDND